MAMAYNVDEEIRVVRNGQAIEAQFPIPPGRGRLRPELPLAASSTTRPRANALLDQFGYKKGADGWRTLPDGKPLAHPLRVAPRLARPPAGRVVEEGVRRHRHPDGGAEGQVPGVAEAREAMQADDAHGVVDRRLSRTPTTSCSSSTARTSSRATMRCANIPEYDRLYEQSLRMPDSPERNRLYHEMAKVIETMRRGGSTSAATATCWCSRGCWDTRSIRSCTPSGSTSTLRGRKDGGTGTRIATGWRGRGTAVRFDSGGYDRADRRSTMRAGDPRSA